MNRPHSPETELNFIARCRSLMKIRREWPVLLTLLLSAAGTWLFIVLADMVVDGNADAIDKELLLLFRDQEDPSRMAGPRWFQEMMRDFTGLGSTGVLTLVTLSAVGFLVLERKDHAALLLLISVLGGVLLSNALKLTFARPRPPFADIGPLVTSASFPSGHSMMSAVVYLTIGAIVAHMRPDPRVGAFVLTLAVFVTVLVGLSRIYLGVHWPTDVLAGWAVGSAWAILCLLVALLLQRRGDIERS